MKVYGHNVHQEMPWLNGGGTTWEVLREPSGAEIGDLDLRVSFARIDQDGPFSSFVGVDRTLVLVSGGPVRLEIGARGEEVHELHPFETVSFDGAAQVASSSAGPSVDLNVMTRRTRWHHAARVVRLAPMDTDDDRATSGQNRVPGRASSGSGAMTALVPAESAGSAESPAERILVAVLDGTHLLRDGSGAQIQVSERDVVTDLVAPVQTLPGSGGGVVVVVTLTTPPSVAG